MLARGSPRVPGRWRRRRPRRRGRGPARPRDRACRRRPSRVLGRTGPGRRTDPRSSGGSSFEDFRLGRRAVRVALERVAAVDQHQGRAAVGQGRTGRCRTGSPVRGRRAGRRRTAGVGGPSPGSGSSPCRLVRRVLDRARGAARPPRAGRPGRRRRPGRRAGRPGRAARRLPCGSWGRADASGRRPRRLGSPSHSPRWGVDGAGSPGRRPPRPTSFDALERRRRRGPRRESRERQPDDPEQPDARSPHLAPRIIGHPRLPRAVPAPASAPARGTYGTKRRRGRSNRGGILARFPSGPPMRKARRGEASRSVGVLRLIRVSGIRRSRSAH